MTEPKTEPAEDAHQQEAGKETAAPEASAAASSTPTPGLPTDLPAAYQNLLAEKKELLDRLLRKQAEFENLRKRFQREKEDFIQHAAAELVRALLPILDGFERALKHRESNVPEKFYQGMDLIYHQMMTVLGRAGLTPIETAGKIFDPHVHQAVETVEAPGYRDHEIVEELQRGYTIKHRLLRAASVKVAAQPREGSSKQSTEEQVKQPLESGSEN